MSRKQDVLKKEEDASETGREPFHTVQPGDGGKSGVWECIAIFFFGLIFVITLPLSIWFAFRTAREFERVAIFRFGRLRKGHARGPGIFFVLPFADTCIKVNLQVEAITIPSQEALTNDAVPINVDAVVYCRVFEPLRSILSVYNCKYSTSLLASTTLRNVIGQETLADILSKRGVLANSIQQILDHATHPWGVNVERVEIKDVCLPPGLHRAMAAEAEATRIAKAKVVAADGELKASRSLRAASDMISQNPGAYHLRYLQTLTTIAGEKNTTIVIPLPIELLQGLSK